VDERVSTDINRKKKMEFPEGKPEVGDVVLLKDEAYPRGQWPLAAR
jgi:hypothetical protein